MGVLAVGTWRLVRFELRRDRRLAAIWLLLLAAVVYASAAATPSLYAGRQERVAAAELINASPAAVALYGPILDVASLGELAMTKTTVLYAMFVMGLGVILVRRHTRVDEESGRLELIAATVVGRQSLLLSAVVEASLVMTALALLTAGANLAGGLPAAGSLLFALSWWGSGLVGIGVGAVAAQVSASARTGALAAVATIGAFYLVRVVGDLGPGWLSWLSPLGWNTQLRAWSGPRIWVLLLYPVLAGSLVAGAMVLRSRRDLGSGLIAERPGRPAAARRLSDPLALTMKIHAHALLAWTVGAAVLGAVFGSLVPNLGALFDSATGRDLLARLGGAGTVQDAMLAGVMSVVAMVLTAFSIAVMVRGGIDESDGRTDLVLATATPRRLTFVGLLAVALGGTTWLLAVTGVSAALGYGAQSGLTDTFARAMAAALTPLPAAWLVGTLALLCLALGSRWAPAGWALLVGFVSVGVLGGLLALPAWVVGLSPFEHVAKVPSEPVSWAAELTLAAMATVVAALAWMLYRRRDIG